MTKEISDALAVMDKKTGSVTLHYKYGKLLKVEYRIIESAAK